MKQFNFTILLTVLMSMVGARAMAHDFEVPNSDGMLYCNITSSTEVAITYRGSYPISYNEYTGNVKIPETVTYEDKTYTVTSIGDGAFGACTELLSVTIPNSVTTIGSQAFAGCNSLASITIPNSVTSIGEYAFNGCSSLTTISIPNISVINNNTFYNCKSLTSVIIPNSVTTIGRQAFMFCESLGYVYLPNSVTSIGSDAFSMCRSLTSITIPNSVTTIGDGAFYGCSNLKSIFVPIDKFDEWVGGSIASRRELWAIKLATNYTYATFYFASSLGQKFEVDSDTKVYKASQKNAETLTLTPVGMIIPNATAVVLKSTNSEIILRYSDWPPMESYSGNILEGTNDDIAVGSDTYYVLGLSGANIGFFEFTGTTLAAHKAYIPATSLDGMSARGLTLEEEDGETTGIESLTPTLSQGEGAVYDLQGRRVEYPTKGIYIVNGKKVFIR